MKKFNFNPNALTAGVALALGLGIATGVSASISSGSVSPNGGVKIENTATADYSVDGVPQPRVTSNAVTVNINEVGSFTLFGTQGDSTTDDKNELQPLAKPDGSTTFKNTLTNTGNVKDTYTIELSDTAGTIITGVTDAFGFTNVTTTPITVTIKNSSDGSTASTTTITSGQSITLLPGQYAELSYSLTADGTGIGGDSGLATITATSQYITNNDPTKATLTNENQAILKLPVFQIVKKATNTSIDLNAPNPSIEYTIVVKNDGSAPYAADATNVLIMDTIPAGLAISTGTITTTVTGGATAGTNSSTTSKIIFNGANIPVNGTVTIKFTATVTDKVALAAAGTVTNNADVYDKYDDTTPVDPNNPVSDIHDSTDTTTTDNPMVPNDPNSTDPNNPGTGGDVPAIVSFTDRNLTMTADTTKELAPTGSETITHTITNKGNTAEGNTAGELVLTIAEGTPGGQVAPTGDITVTIKNSGGNTIATKTYPAGTTTIDFYDVSTGGIPVGGTATVTYTEVSANNYDTTTQNPLVATDTTTLTLTPTGPAAPAPITNTDTFHVKDMDLAKTQALDANCDGIADGGDSAFTGSGTSITANPSECVIYRITATNNFTTKALTNVVISDAASNWSAKATYVAGSGKDSAGGTVTPPGTSVTSSTFSIPATGTGWLQFAIKINQ